MSEVASDGSLPAEAACGGEGITAEPRPVRMIDPVIVQRAYAANVHARKAMECVLGMRRGVDEAC
jgi:hypothetical protein